MGSRSKRPYLSTATDSDAGHGDPAVDDDVAASYTDDLDTALTVNSSYTIPPGGQPIKIPTKRRKGRPVDKQDSQASLLIDLYNHRSTTSGRPSVRVRVSSHGKPVHITEIAKGRKISQSQVPPVAHESERYSWEAAGMTYSELSDRGPVGIDIDNNVSEISSNVKLMPNPSTVSDMPNDSMQGAVRFMTENKDAASVTSDEHRITGSTSDKPSSLSQRRSRSLSRERREEIQKRAIKKARAIEGSPEESGRRRLRKSRDKTASNETSERDQHTRSRRSSKTHSSRDSGDFRSATITESSLHPKDADSNLSHSNASQLSKSSLANNPRLLQTVEDAIRRMILPEIDEIKRKQSVRETKDSRSVRDSTRTDTTVERESERSTKSRDADELKSKKLRKSRDATSDGRSSRRTSASSKDITERTSKKPSSRHSSQESEGLTTAALKDHNKRDKERELHDERHERRERRKKRSQSKSESRSDSIAHTEDEYYDRSKIPPMPLQSINESDLTRDSILSAETNDTYSDRPASSRNIHTPVQAVARASPREVPLPESRASTRTPVGAGARSDVSSYRETASASPVTTRSERDVKSTKSDKSVSTKSRHAHLSAAGLGGATGALYGYHRANTDRSRSRQSSRTAESSQRDISPVQSETNTAQSDSRLHDPSELEQVIDAYGPSTSNNIDVTKSIESGRSSPSARSPVTQKRADGIELNDAHLSRADHSAQTARRAFDTSGETYRDSYDFDSKRTSGLSDWDANRLSFNESLDSPAVGQSFVQQQVKTIAANAQIYKNPVLAQSETGSLLNPSQLSSSPSAQQTPARSFDSQSFRARQHAADNRRMKNVMPNEEENISQDRWKYLKANAQALSGSKEQLQDSQVLTRSVQTEEPLQMGASGIPVADDPMPEIGYGHDDDDVTNPSIREKPSSILEGPLGDEGENRDHWPYEPTPDFSKASNWPQANRDEPYVSAGNASMMGAAAGLGIGRGTAPTPAGSRNVPQQDDREPSERSQSSASRDMDDARHEYRNKGFSPLNNKDEGYISAAQPRSPDNITPLSFSKAPPTLFGGKDHGYDPAAVDEDPFTEQDKRSRHISNNSHGMSTGYFDAATGKGINNIQSADVVALMDHLAVRDGHRSARDSELIFTLIQSATEMRTNFDQVKQLLEVQSNANVKNQDKNTDRLMARILGGPKPQVLGSPRGPSSRSIEEAPAKKQNVFKRALKGLGSKSSNDVTEIQAMLLQVLDEIENLKASQAGSVQAPSMAGAPRESMDTEQRFQQVPDPGYEPEGQAGTGSTPSHSGYFSPSARKPVPQSQPQSQPQMHSAYGANNRISANRMSTNRVSTVFEDDGEFDQAGDRLLTPTQEAQRQRSASYETPRQPSNNVLVADDSPNIGMDSEERRFRRHNRHISFPRMSRWSKTTEESGTEPRFSIDTSQPAGRPYSQALSQGSQSGEAVNAIPGFGGEPWSMHEDDRLRSANSLARGDDGRAHSPLIPEEMTPSRDLQAEVSPESAADPRYNNFKHDSLPLQHPQPRQGPTGRHRNHLEDQAYDYDDRDMAMSEGGESAPDNELFGSVPALARFPGGFSTTKRMSNNAPGPQNHHGMVSPPSSSQGDPNSPSMAYRSGPRPQPGAARPPKIQEGPALPPKISLTQPTPQQQLTPAYTGDTDSPARSAHSQTPSSVVTSSLGSFDNEDDVESPSYPLNTIDRKRSPYMPGGPLAPIEERYSMEADRSSLAHSLSQRSRRQSAEGRDTGSRGHSRQTSAVDGRDVRDGMYQHLGQVAEGDERAVTPTRSPRLAVGAGEKGGEVRKLTGPREMPGSVLKGTVRRKPVFTEG